MLQGKVTNEPKGERGRENGVRSIGEIGYEIQYERFPQIPHEGTELNPLRQKVSLSFSY